MVRVSLSLAAVASLLASSASARPEYVDGVPNVSCGECHVSAGGGGPRNAFGEDVEKTMPFTGPDTETWAKLFCVDSDGDGETNGQELADPCGVWRIGDASPDGDISNPGNDSEVTGVAGECDGEAPPTCDLEVTGGICAQTTPAGLMPLALFALALISRRRIK